MREKERESYRGKDKGFDGASTPTVGIIHSEKRREKLSGKEMVRKQRPLLLLPLLTVTATVTIRNGGRMELLSHTTSSFHCRSSSSSRNLQGEKDIETEREREKENVRCTKTIWDCYTCEMAGSTTEY